MANDEKSEKVEKDADVEAHKVLHESDDEDDTPDVEAHQVLKKVEK